MESLLDKMVNNNLRGKELEKEGNIDVAIRLYEENISLRFDGSFPYDRLITIYRKQKDYANESRVLENAIDVFTHDIPQSRPDRDKKLTKYKERLNKVYVLIQ